MSASIDGMIRPARPDDIQLLHELTLRSTMHWGYEPAFLDWEPEAIEVTPAFFARSIIYLLEEDGRITGYYAFTGDPPDGLAFDKLFVEPDLIGTGRGKHLWRHAVEIARSLGATEFSFYADPNAGPFYRAMGAEWLESIPTAWPGWELQRFRFAIPDVGAPAPE